MVEELTGLSGSDMYPFHMPGHKRQGTGSRDWLEGAYAHDITEIDGFDDLQAPCGLIADIETRLAALYKAEKAFLSVNGSTCGNLSAVAALVPGGGCLLSDKEAHRSIFNAAFLLGCDMLFLERKTLPDSGLTACISPEETERGLKRAKSDGRIPDAVLITSPTYEGFVSDVDTISDIVHEYGIPIIVDGAHGAHFTADRGTGFPKMSVKPDITVVSLHKTLPALTQVSAVLVNGSLIRPDVIKRYINIFQTTSPSYILMASADRCLDIMENRGAILKNRLKERLETVYSLNSTMNRLYFTGPEYKGKYGIFDFDKSRINVTDRTGRMTGQDLYDIFRNKYHIQPEKAGERTCLLLTSIMDSEKGFERLVQAVKEMDI